MDLGSGAGFPGLALAAARPEMAVTLVESERRKADWLRRASADFPNVRVVADRSEHLASARARDASRVATARALGPLPVALELAAPLVARGRAPSWRGAASDVRPGGARPPPRAPPASSASSRARPTGGTPFPGARRRLQRLPQGGSDAEPVPAPRRAGRQRPLGGA